MTKKILIIDDMRTEKNIQDLYPPMFTDGQSEPDVSVIIARTYTLGINALRFLGPWDILYLDHDLGDAVGKTGYHVICWLEECAFDYKFDLLPKELICISSNGAGRERIVKGWEHIQNKLPTLAEEYVQKYKDIIKRGYE